MMQAAKPIHRLLQGLLILMAFLDSSIATATPFDQRSEADWQALYNEVTSRYGAGPLVVISVSAQRMMLLENGLPVAGWPVSTSRHGTGSKQDSYQTPLGVHRVAEKIGDGAPPGTWFVARQNTGRVATILQTPERSEEDYVTSRILWLDGLEAGVNRGPGVDSHQRYIYIHGTDEEGLIGQPASEGCIRMRNHDVIELFDRIPAGTLVLIEP